MNDFPHPDGFHLQAARGWLELGDWSSANDELEQISPELRSHPSVLLTRCDIYLCAERWDYVIPVAETLVKMLPENTQGWIQRSYAFHELKQTEEAFNKLQPAASAFPKNWVIPYNLACYCAQLGRIQDAETWFKQAIALDEKTVQSAAIDDPDLIPLWEGMRGSSWSLR